MMSCIAPTFNFQVMDVILPLVGGHAEPHFQDSRGASNTIVLHPHILTSSCLKYHQFFHMSWHKAQANVIVVKNMYGEGDQSLPMVGRECSYHFHWS